LVFVGGGRLRKRGGCLLEEILCAGVLREGKERSRDLLFEGEVARAEFGGERRNKRNERLRQLFQGLVGQWRVAAMQFGDVAVDHRQQLCLPACTLTSLKCSIFDL